LKRPVHVCVDSQACSKALLTGLTSNRSSFETKVRALDQTSAFRPFQRRGVVMVAMLSVVLVCHVHSWNLCLQQVSVVYELVVYGFFTGITYSVDVPRTSPVGSQTPDRGSQINAILHNCTDHTGCHASSEGTTQRPLIRSSGNDVYVCHRRNWKY
jgi:hypothetical protein